MFVCRRYVCSFLLASLLLPLAACNKQKPPQQKQSGQGQPAKSESDAGGASDERNPQTARYQRAVPTPRPAPEDLISSSFLRSDSPAAAAARHPGLSELSAINKVTQSIVESTERGPTLVVWLFDRTESASRMVSGIQAALIRFYEQVAAGELGKGSANNLFTSIVSFGGTVDFHLEEPTSSTTAVIEALGTLARDSGGKELTFAAVETSLKTYREYRASRRYEVMLVIVTDEAGDDPQRVESIIESPEYSPRRLGIPVYVLGVPAPFGREAGSKGTPEGDKMRQGPESREAERIDLGFWGSAYGVDLIDSGFGPFELEWLCRDSGGLYLALRPTAGKQRRFHSQFDEAWPTLSAGRFDPAVMRRYAPAYVSGKVYQAEIAANRAKRSLVEAARLQRAGVLDFPPVEFVIRDEAKLQRDLNEAQKNAARLEPEIEQFFVLLSGGEGDREQISEPRWQAGFDLALGRVMAAKARIEGYNHMLAALKRGMKFENPASDRWLLEPAEATLDAGSGIEKLCAKARMYLERVVRDHPDTPWAAIAKRELETQLGWKWTEKGPNG